MYWRTGDRESRQSRMDSNDLKLAISIDLQEIIIFVKSTRTASSLGLTLMSVWFISAERVGPSACLRPRSLDLAAQK